MTCRSLFRAAGIALILLACRIPSVHAQAIRELSGHSGPVTGVAFSPEGRQIVSASFDHTLRIWDVQTGRELRACRGHEGKVTAVAYSPNGVWIASASLDRSVRLWEARTGEQRLVMASSERSLQAIRFSPDGRYLYGAGESGSVVVLDLLLRQVTRHPVSSQPLFTLALTRDGKHLAAAGHDRRVHVLLACTGQRLHTLECPAGDIYSLSFCPAGENLSTGEEGGRLLVWDLKKGKAVVCHEEHSAAIYQVGFSSDGRHLVSAGLDGQVLIRDAATGNILHSHRLPDKTLCAAIAPDGQSILTGSGKASCYLMDLPRRLR